MTDWRANLQRNWLYMLTATLLSVFLWVAVSADRVDERTYSADLLVVNSDRRYVETRREPDIEEVTVDFTGRVGELARLAVARPQVIVRIDTVDSNEMEVRLSSEDVTGRGGASLEGVSAIRVQPDRLLLRFQLRGTKTVPVVPDMSRLRLEDGYVLSDSVRVEPGMVALDGPEDIVTGIDSVVTAPVPGTSTRVDSRIAVPGTGAVTTESMALTISSGPSSATMSGSTRTESDNT